MTPLAPVPVLTLVVGQKPAPTAGTFYVDLADILEYGLFVQGMTRSGKTNFVRYIVESAHGHVPIYILDVEGEYATLRTEDRAFLVVGKGRDYELAPRREDVQQLMNDLVARRISAIFDLSEYEEDEAQLIIAAFCDAAVALPENHPGEKLVVLDELQEAAPEGGGKGTALNSVRRLSKRGLKRGFAMLGASQRTADVSNGVLTQLKSKAVGGSDDADVPKALLQLGLGPRSRQALVDLEQGEFWVKGPAFSRHAVHVRIPRASSSPAKRRRGDGAAPASKASGEIAELAATLAAAAAARAEAERASLEAEAQSRTRRLPAGERGDDAALTAPDPAALEQARAEGVASERARWTRICAVFSTGARVARDRVIASMTELQETASLLDGVAEEASHGCTAAAIAPVAAAAPVPPIASVAPAPATGAAGRLRVSAGGTVRLGEQKILDALAELSFLRVDPASRTQLSVMADMDVSGGSPNRYLNALIDRDLVARAGTGLLALTEEGRAQAAAPPARLSPAAFRERALDRLAPGERKILACLVNVYPQIVSRPTLSAAVQMDVSGGSPNRYLNKLITLGLVEIPSRGMLRAGAALYPEVDHA